MLVIVIASTSESVRSGNPTDPLPRDYLVLVGSPGVPESEATVEFTTFGRLLAEPRLQRLFGKIYEVLVKLGDGVSSQASEELNPSLSSSLRGSVLEDHGGREARRETASVTDVVPVDCQQLPSARASEAVALVSVEQRRITLEQLDRRWCDQ